MSTVLRSMGMDTPSGGSHIGLSGDNKMLSMSDKFAVNFYITGVEQQFARRTLTQVPQIGSRCVFKEKRYEVLIVEWCLDDDSTNYTHKARINIELKPI